VTRSIDFSTEVGEGFAIPPFGLPVDFWRGLDAGGERIHPRHFMQRFEDEMLPYISSAGIACGVHSGDPVVIARAARRLAERDIAIGAHPSYPDVFHFGQHRVALEPAELEAVLLFQFGALGAIARAHG
jgi:lactam utilization protein B